MSAVQSVPASSHTPDRTAGWAEHFLTLASPRDVPRLLGLLAEHRDPDIGGHLRRIQEYTRLLAEELAARGLLAPSLAADTVAASVLHDVGKVAIPEAILFKPGPLTADEFRVIRRHTTAGAAILRGFGRQLGAALGGSSTFLQVAVDIARHHHERWDGQGYPDGRRGEEIPLPARIVAVADVYDALTSRRVYKPAWSHARARALILAAAGSQFDPAVVAAFAATERRCDRIRRRAAGVPEAPALLFPPRPPAEAGLPVAEPPHG